MLSLLPVSGLWGQALGKQASGAPPPTGIISTVAGADWLFSGGTVAALATPLGDVYGLAAGPSGSMYIVDDTNSMVFRLSGGTMTTMAGNGLSGGIFGIYSGDGGPAKDTMLFQPRDAVVDPDGNILICDTGYNRVRIIRGDGSVQTYAGGAGVAFAGDNGPATGAALLYAMGLALDPQGNLYISDSGHFRIRRVDRKTQVITTYAGNGLQGDDGDNGPAIAARIDSDSSFGGQMAFDAAGNLYFATADCTVRKVTPAGIISTFAGKPRSSAGADCPTSAGDGVQATTATFYQPKGIAVDAAGNVYIGELAAIRKIGPDGIVHTIAGNLQNKVGFAGDGSVASAAVFNGAWRLAFDTAGNLYVSDFYNQRVRRIDPSQNITTVAGNKGYRPPTEGALAETAFLRKPAALVFDGSGNLIFADSEHNRIAMISASDRTIRTVAGSDTGDPFTEAIPATQARLTDPKGVTLNPKDGTVCFSEQIVRHRIRCVDPAGLVRTIAGSGDRGYAGDGGLATLARLNNPAGIIFDAQGNLFIADHNNNVVRRVDPSGKISTFAGTGTAALGGDEGPAAAAQLNQPSELAIDAAGNLYIADTWNYRVRKVTLDGIIHSVATTATSGGPLAPGYFNRPQSLAADAAGNLFVGEYAGYNIRWVDPTGYVQTITGLGRVSGTGDGGPASLAGNYGPDGAMALDGSGNLYFSDSNHNRIRVIRAAGSSTPITAAPASLSFAALSGGALSDPQTIAVSAGIGLPYSVSTVTADGTSWLRTSVASGVAPASLEVQVDPSGLVAGTYNGTVAVQSAAGDTANVTVNLVVGTGRDPVMSVDPAPLTLYAAVGGPPVGGQVPVKNPSGGQINFAVSSLSLPSWIGFTSGAGIATPASLGAVSVFADPTGLPAGVYRDTLLISSLNTADPAVQVPVVFIVSKPRGRVLLSQTGLRFTAVEGGGAPLPQTVEVLNIGLGSLSWTASAAVLRGTGWLTLQQSAGVVIRPNLDLNPLGVQVHSAGLPAGDYYGRITVTSPDADNGPQTITVVLSVLPAGTTLPPEIRPSGLVFVGSQVTADRGNNPASQSVYIANLGSAAVRYQSAHVTPNANDWFVHSPSNAGILPNEPLRMVVQPDFSQLQPGLFRGTVALNFPDSGTAGSIEVVALVSPLDGSNALRSVDGHRNGSGCAETSLNIQVAQPVLTAALTQPFPFDVNVFDNCGNPVSGSSTSVQVVFDNGDPQLPLAPQPGGKFTATWHPAGGTPGTTTTARVIAFLVMPNGNVLGALKTIPVRLTSGSLPSVPQGGIVNAASLHADPAVAPGALITIKGSSLADTQAASGAPYPTTLGSTSVLLAGLALPLLYASDGQINAQLPYGLPENVPVQLTVQHGTAPSVPQTIDVASAQPAIFTADASGTGQGTIRNAAGNTVDADHPATAGDTVVILANGLGAVKPAVAAGSPPAAGTAPVTVNPVSVWIDGVPAQVISAGLDPTTAGVYLVTAVVPPGTSTGPAISVVLAAAGQLSPSVTMAVR